MATTHWSHDGSCPVKHVVTNWTSTTIIWGISIQVLELLLDSLQCHWLSRIEKKCRILFLAPKRFHLETEQIRTMKIVIENIKILNWHLAGEKMNVEEVCFLSTEIDIP